MPTTKRKERKILAKCHLLDGDSVIVFKTPQRKYACIVSSGFFGVPPVITYHSTLDSALEAYSAIVEDDLFDRF